MSPSKSNKQPDIELFKVSTHNLKDIDIKIPSGKIIVITGVSGSGKSSLAFDTIYIEGQRRYLQSLSHRVRRHLENFPKPPAKKITGMCPTIAIEQKTAGKNPRSTVGTVTAVYDYLRLIFSRLGDLYCPVSLEKITPISRRQICEEIFSQPDGSHWMILANIASNKRGSFKDECALLLKKGFSRVRIDQNFYHLSDDVISLNEKASHTVDVVIDRISIQKENKHRIQEAIDAALDMGKGVLSLYNPKTKEELVYSEYAYSPKSKIYYRPLEPEDFSFNHPRGMCDVCHGLGELKEFSLDLIIDPEKSVEEDFCLVAPHYDTVKWGNIYDNIARIFRFSTKTPWKKLSQEAKDILLYGDPTDKWHRMLFCHPDTGKTWTDFVRWRGIFHEAKTRLSESSSDSYKKKMENLMTHSVCHGCHGARIKPYPRVTRFRNKTIVDLCSMMIKDLIIFFESLSLSQKEEIIAYDIIQEILTRLQFLQNVGLEYLTLHRSAPTLSGGESQRIRLASGVGFGLVNTAYILDEPSIGLHPMDTKRLIDTLKMLRDKGNTVIVVEHDEEMIREADWVIDMGPLAGHLGGEVVAQGDVSHIMKAKKSLTADFLSGRECIPIPKKIREPKGFLTVKKAEYHNLKSVNVSIPLQVLTVVTGVSGSGKSSLILETLYPAVYNHINRSNEICGAHKSISGLDQIDKVICIDQSPIGRTPRSNPGTYVKVLDAIRDLFAELPQSKMYGYTKGFFSFNVKEGSCPKCHGLGFIKIDMDFMEDEWVVCPQCNQNRFDNRVLSVLYKGKNIRDVLDMSILEALEFFQEIPPVYKKLETLCEVGLGYLSLGQSSTELSGGEAQRLKLCKELMRPAKGHTLYVLDEPTTGLHMADIQKLIPLLQRLCSRGNSMIIIEHNLDIIKCADWIIDLGPGGGENGGKVLFSGTVQKACQENSLTGKALKAYLAENSPTKKAKKTSSFVDSNMVIEGASQNNLKDVSLSIPKNQIVAFTGPSGSGKTSLALDTIYAEAQRRYVDSLSPYMKKFIPQRPKASVENMEGLSPSIALEQKRHSHNPRSTLGTMTEIHDFLRILYARLGVAHCPETGEEIKHITVEYVAKKVCELPEKTKFSLLAPVEIPKGEDFSAFSKRLQNQGYLRIRLNKKFYELDDKIPYRSSVKNSIEVVVDRLRVQKDIDTRLLESLQTASFLGNQQIIICTEKKDFFFNLDFALESTGDSFKPITHKSFSFNSSDGMCMSCYGLGFLEDDEVCPDCSGERLNPLSRAVTIHETSLPKLCQMPLDEACLFLQDIDAKESVLKEVLDSIKTRFMFLMDLGLGYLALDRSAPTLSGGEMQRAQIARQLGSGLTGILYVLDEPTIGLHPYNNEMLQKSLEKLRDLGNSVLLVEHDPLTLKKADRIYDFGPKSGRLGGELLAEGSYTEILKNKNSLTGLYLSGKKSMPKEPSKRDVKDAFLIKDAHLHNLQHIQCAIPKKAMTCVTGISGSGKSTLVHELIYSAIDYNLSLRKKKKNLKTDYAHFENIDDFDQVIFIDQAPIGITMRSDICTYSDLLTPLRMFFSQLPDAQARGLLPMHFSYYHKKGMCPKCRGLGSQIISLQFMPDAEVLCPSCHGKRLNPLSLSVSYKGKTLGDILELTVEDAKEFLPKVPKVQKVLDRLISVGLGYLLLGQRTQTLSGGESGRLRLSKELAKSRGDHILYLLDEPTTGLHLDDIAKILPILHSLVDKGNTVIVVEHNTDIIKQADYILELGPESGKGGGRVIASGAPKGIRLNKLSLIRHYI